MANKGKRMVFEKDIARIGQGGGGGSYTAGNGINISEEDVISVDNTVALKSELFSGDYDDLTDKPDLSIYAQSANLATVATTGAYSDLTGTPTIPAAVSGTNDGTNWTSLTVGADTYAIPQGGGSDLHLVAGTGIDITNGEVEGDKVISVDNTIATKSEVNAVAARTATLYSYMDRPIDVYNELIAKEPTTTNQDAITEWLKRMPAFVSTNINAAGISTLEGMGFANIIQVQPGAEYDIQGYFSIIFEGTTNTAPYAMGVCMADRVGSATKQLWNTAPGPRIQHTVVIGSTQIEFQNCRFREANTTLSSYTDLFNNAIAVVQQMGVNAQTEAMLGMSNAMVSFAGREAETIAISVQGGTGANNQFNSQLKAPTADGSYQLGCTVSSGVPTFAWGSGGSTPTNMMTTNTAQTGLSGNKEYGTGNYYRFGALNAGTPWSQISNNQISNNDGVGASASFSNGILTVQDNSIYHYIKARPDYLEHSIDGGSTGDKIYFDDLVALIAYAKSQGWIQ